MKINVVNSLAGPVGSIWRELQSKADASGFLVASPLSSTPLPLYEWLITNAGSLHNWDLVNFVLMDEQVQGQSGAFQYVPKDDLASYEGFAKKYLLDSLRAKTGAAIEVLKPDLDTIETFAAPIDLLILALGASGNYANVMPGTEKTVGWHIACLTPEFRQSHTQKDSQSYAGAEFREFGMSLGPQQVLSSKRVIVIISGAKKHDLSERLFTHQRFDPKFPLSIIFDRQVTDRVQVFITEDVGIPKTL
jgi:6-phosphogluconolactonase/glucosamine-6-phosphate isomerase/deaminase